MISDKERQIQESLANNEYREALAIEHVNTTLAIQIRKMREKQPWSQSDLANRLGKHQETISQWENPDYGRHSITTLKKLAGIFDVALLVKFIPFSELVKDMISLSDNRLSPPSFSEEMAYPHTLTTVSVGWNSAEGVTTAAVVSGFPTHDALEGFIFASTAVNARAYENVKIPEEKKELVYA